MSDDQKLSAYIVAATFGEPPNARICTTAVIAPNSESAVAMAVATFVQRLNIAEQITGVATDKLEPDFLRAALREQLPKVVPFGVVGDPA